MNPAEVERVLAEDVAQYAHDPLGFSYYAFPWGKGELQGSDGPRKWQREVQEYIGTHLQNKETRHQPCLIAVASGKGIGKSAEVGMLIAWAMSTCVDCKVILTANTDPQLRTKTWPEVCKWFNLAINKRWFLVEGESITIRNPAHKRLWRCDRITWSEKNPEAFAGLHNEGKITEIISIVEEARANGREVVSDQYPYDGAATSTLANIIVFRNVSRGDPRPDVKAALRNRSTRARLKETSENGIEGGFAWLKATGYSSMRITSSTDYPELVGRYLSEIAQQRGVDPFDLVSELIIGADAPVGITLGAIKEHDVRLLMVQPWNMIASDGAYSDGETPRGHPRSTGTFPRVLGRYVREWNVLTLEQAVHKMTALPAKTIGLNDRGRLAEGAAADVTVFDPATVIDRSTWEEPQLFSVGIEHVIVNGVSVLRDGEMTGEAPGRVLRHER